MSQKKIEGIINVVNYGYCYSSGIASDQIFRVGTNPYGEVKSEYLNLGRQTELGQLEEWIPYLTSDTKVKWVITAINKADIWYDKETEVLDYYQTGDYYLKYIRTIEKVCKCSFLSYCSLISPFGNTPMILSMGERQKKVLHDTFIETVIKIIQK